MPHDVFISHSARDKPYADAVCAKLESQNIRCWIAPRDIAPGMDWGAAILEAIDGARVMLLVFSAHANASPQIKREVERAVNKELIVVPVRVEDVKPTGNLEYFLGTPHWLDAITPPFERHLDRIADSTKFWLERIKGDSTTPEPPVARPSLPVMSRDEPSAATSTTTEIARPRTRPKWIAPTIAALVIALVATVAYFATRYFDAQQELAREQAAQQAPPRLRAQPFTGENPTAAKTFREPEMVVVPAGTFTMGSPPSEPGRYDDEGPQHRVAIGRAFAVSKYPVTRDEYAQFAWETSSASKEWLNPTFQQTGEDPVVNVSWDDAKAYVAWMSEKTGKSYRLLSESEYEYAERARTTTVFWWGNNSGEVCSHANARECGHNGTVKVGSYPANAFGLYDMAGNVWEWTEDCSHESYAGAPEDGTAWTTGDCGQRVLRGGSWGDLTRDLRSASGDGNYTGDRDVHDGFRVARTL
jgi:formylglycine-generating enzyme required for sulfatase activity